MNTADNIEIIKKQWGPRLKILGHYYQRDEVLRHADIIGDSLELARSASLEKEAEKIVFCGVHFMAESADLLAQPNQKVYMPDIEAGCPMADMAPAGELKTAWNSLRQYSDEWLPIIYVNSSAAAKAFCGSLGGCTCTSRNAVDIVRQILTEGKRVFFIPDEHLAYNTANDLGIPEEETATFDPSYPLGGLTPETIRKVKVLAWKGYCHVHSFTVEDVIEARRRYPSAKIIVHPETPAAVVNLTDAHGSTSQIVEYVAKAADNSIVIVGTEFNLVRRLVQEHQQRLTIAPLRVSACPNMARTTAKKLLHTLQTWPAENIVRVPDEYRQNARLALERMFNGMPKSVVLKDESWSAERAANYEC